MTIPNFKKILLLLLLKFLIIFCIYSENKNKLFWLEIFEKNFLFTKKLIPEKIYKI